MGVRPRVQHRTGGDRVGSAAIGALRYEPSVPQAPGDLAGSHEASMHQRRAWRLWARRCACVVKRSYTASHGLVL